MIATDRLDINSKDISVTTRQMTEATGSSLTRNWMDPISYHHLLGSHHVFRFFSIFSDFQQFAVAVHGTELRLDIRLLGYLQDGKAFCVLNWAAE